MVDKENTAADSASASRANSPLPAAGGEGRGGAFLFLNLSLCAVLGAIFVIAYFTGFFEPRPGSLCDSDCYVHLLRAEKLWQTGRWYDPVLERSNTPYGGEELHWSRPFDVLLLIGGVPASLFVGLRPALFWWGVILSPVLLAVTLAALPWVVRPLLGRDGALIVGVMFVCQLGVWGVFQAGRPDHHSLLMLLFALTLGFSLRLIEYPFDARTCRRAGLIGALALWVSIESSLSIGLSLLALAGLWIIRGGDFPRKAFHYSTALAAGVALALVLERPAANLSAVEFDRLSIAHGVPLGLLAAFWGATAFLDRRCHPLRSPLGRLLTVCAGAAACAVVSVVLFPNWCHGPLARVDPEVMQIYVRKVDEMQPLWASSPGRTLAISVITGILVSTPLLVRRAAKGHCAAAWQYVSAILLAFMLLSFLEVRWAAYAQVPLALALTEIIAAAWARLDRWPHNLKRTLAKSGIWAACCYSLLFLPGVIGTLLGGEEEQGPPDRASLPAMCRYLAETQPYAGQHLRVLAHIFWGGEILYRTPHEVVATPYHRNARGILDDHRAFSSGTDDEALKVIRQRGINLILVCPVSQPVHCYYRIRGRASTFYDRLCESEIPVWCREVPLPPELADFRLFEVHDQ